MVPANKKRIRFAADRLAEILEQDDDTSTAIYIIHGVMDNLLEVFKDLHFFRPEVNK